ncbi:hypothetical protein DFR70_104498 [Nocardia tenerifensis]|uniref:Uncharacterized protein n=1 Tax=Nocardia tenerifensis TaxID=228006 RepID=A0A318K1Q4_9NOCA|nr:hypothetical protein [Nocardia tenerifensis]PXX65434.1 hypothetical protein DFR70_104498 [Nocardia tenerifensis]
MGDGGGRRGWWVPAGYSAVLALVIGGPLWGSGYLLLRDAVSTPRSYPTDSALGLGDAAPRAVPQDGLLAVLSTVVDGGLIVKVILFVALWAAGYGAAVLARELVGVPVGGQLVASTVAVWNPHVAERLLQGHWSLLAGYAALPWVALCAYRIRAGGGDLGAWAGLAGFLAAAGLTPTGSLLAGVTALTLVGRRHVAGALGLLIAACAPWLTATALSGVAGEPSDPAGIAAFAARAEPGLGTLGSLAGLGGIWNGDAVPGSRTTLLALIGTGLLLVIVATGVRSVVANADASGGNGNSGGSADSGDSSSGDSDSTSGKRYVRRALVVLAVPAVLLPALGATAWGMHVMEWLVAQVPGAGLLRDTQKYVALAMPAYALCAAAGCGVLARRFSTGERADTLARNRDQSSADEHAASPEVAEPFANPSPAVTRSLATVFIVLLMLPLLDLAWGVGGAMRPVHYPAGWQRVAGHLDGPGDVAVLPGGMFRRFRYSGQAPVLDPAPRLLPRDVLQTGELPVRGRTVSGEGARARAVEAVLLHGGSAPELAERGVGWVLVEHGTPGPLGESRTTLARLDPVFDDADLTLYRVPGDIRAHDGASSHRGFVIAAHALWALLLVGGPALAVTARRARRTP